MLVACLYIHRLMHTHRSIKPFKCFYCDYHSNMSGNVNLHCRLKHKGTYLCNDVTAAFVVCVRLHHKHYTYALLNYVALLLCFTEVPQKWIRVCEKFPANHNEMQPSAASTSAQTISQAPADALADSSNHALSGAPANTLAGAPANTLAGAPDYTLAGVSANTLAEATAHTLSGAPAHTLAGAPTNELADATLYTMTGDSAYTETLTGVHSDIYH